MNRQNKVIGTLFILLVLAIGYAWWMMPEQRRVGDGPAVRTPQQQAAARTPAGSAASKLRVDLLDREPVRFQGAKRDIFNFADVKPKPKPEPKPDPKPQVQPPPVKPQVEPARPTVSTVVRQQLARFTFLGFLVRDEQRTVFLSKGEDLFLVKEGEQFGDDKQFTAIAITPERLTIRQSGDTRPIEIMLVEQEPLIPSIQTETTPTASPFGGQRPTPPPQAPPRSGWKRPGTDRESIRR